jgi:hypothetical protein
LAISLQSLFGVSVERFLAPSVPPWPANALKNLVATRARPRCGFIRWTPDNAFARATH